MRIAAYVALLLLAATLIGAQEAKQDTKKQAAEAKKMFATNLCLSKGGLGIVNTNLYIAVKSARNELLFGQKETWSGSDASEAEIAVFFAGKVWALQSEMLPKGFDLSKAVVVSFEGDKVRFFDFQTMSGGYYERIRD
jgi:hypothetical protein